MQTTIDIPKKLADKLRAITKEKDEQDEIIKQALEEKFERIKKFKNDPFTKWILNEKTCFKDKPDVSEKHDKYLYGGKK